MHKTKLLMPRYDDVFISYIGNGTSLTWQVISCMYLVSCRARHTVVRTLPSYASTNDSSDNQSCGIFITYA